MTKQTGAPARSALKLALEVLETNRRTHYYCEDTWYSCPKHEEGCANEAEGDACNCGADSANVEIEKAITAIREALALVNKVDQEESSGTEQPAQQDMVAEYIGECNDGSLVQLYDDVKKGTKFYTSPPAQRKPLTDEQIQKIWDVAAGAIPGWSRHIAYARAIEAAHGIYAPSELKEDT